MKKTNLLVLSIAFIFGCNSGNRKQTETFDVLPVFTERTFKSYWIGPDSCWNPYLKTKEPFSKLSPLFHVYTGSQNQGENETGALNLEFRGSNSIKVPEGNYCMHYLPKTLHTIAGLTYKKTDLLNEGGKHGSSFFEEYICDFSDYKDVGKFYFRYLLEKGAKYKIMAKVAPVYIEGTGEWNDVIIEPLNREIFTHHTIIWIEDLNDKPTEIYIDDAFFYKGNLPSDLKREKEYIGDQIFNIYPVFTERNIIRHSWKPDSGYSAALNHKAPVSELTPLFHVYSGSINTGENETGKLNLTFEGNDMVSVPEGKYCLQYVSKKTNSIAGLTYKNLSVKKTTKDLSNSQYEEYVTDFSIYSEDGKFQCKYWLKKGAKYSISAKNDSLVVEGTGKWENLIIPKISNLPDSGLSILCFRDLNETPTEIYIDDAYFYKGKLKIEY